MKKVARANMLRLEREGGWKQEGRGVGEERRVGEGEGDRGREREREYQKWFYSHLHRHSVGSSSD